MTSFENEENVTGSEHALRAILQDLIGQHQFQLPVQLLIADSDGSFQFAVIEEQSLQPFLVTQHLPHSQLTVPTHWILIDAAGRAAHYLLQATPDRPFGEGAMDGTVSVRPVAFVDLRSVQPNMNHFASFPEAGDTFREIFMSLMYDHLFAWPIYSIAIGCNHSLIAKRFEMDEANVNAVPHHVAEHIVGGGLATPASFFWLDSGPDAKVAWVHIGTAQSAYLQ